MVNEIGNDFESMTTMIDGWSKSHFLGGYIAGMVSEDENNDRNECRVRARLSDFDCIGPWRWYDCGIG